MVKHVWKCGAAALVCLIVCLAGGRPAGAQILSGSLSGNIVDETGALVSGADVTLTNEASKDVRRTKTNSEGFFTFAGVPPGSYAVRIELAGFKTTERTGVRIRIGDSRSLGQMPLSVGGRAEETVVTAQVEMVPLNSGEKSATLSSD